ncbi:MAG: preprotein translocase subunit SecY [Oscillospiraceae bacterium]|nr:preprotein translocase subunit SecY [Oscillospiraceae bacterium]
MFQTLRNAWKMADLRKKLLYTLLIIVIFRIGAAIPIPFLDPSALATLFNQGENTMLGYLDILTGGALANGTLFALSIQPYINASIIIQLLMVAIPPLGRLAKEGEVGQKKVGMITRWVTLALALVQAIGYYFIMKSYGAVEYTKGFDGWYALFIILACFTAGSCLIVWLGERIDENGIGNGISMILFAGIVSRGPSAVNTLLKYWEMGNQGYTQYYFLVPLVAVLFVAVIGFIVFFTNAERKLPVQYAKRVVGRKMYGGQSSYIPIKVNMSGVMPIIFASSFVSLPATIKTFANISDDSTWGKILGFLNPDTIAYAIIYFLLIIFFNFFYVQIQYNPVEIANNLQKNNGAIPGIRPGKPTYEFIQKVLGKVVFLGALFLGLIATLPILLGKVTGMGIQLGGTTVLILVGVALETTQQMESQMMMRHYKGFLE